jgi:hypothetical protein
MVGQPDWLLADRIAADRAERQRSQRHRRAFTSAFVQQTKGTLGDERRNQVFGPPQRRVDFSVFKLFDIRESMRVQLRTEVFNLTNTANFAGPGASLGAANFGIISATTPGSTPREIQFVLKLLF